MPSLAVPFSGLRMNERAKIWRDGEPIYLAGIDDAHFFNLDDIQKALELTPRKAFSLLPSHTPEVYRQAAHADVDLLLCGHTHGG